MESHTQKNIFLHDVVNSSKSLVFSAICVKNNYFLHWNFYEKKNLICLFLHKKIGNQFFSVENSFNKPKPGHISQNLSVVKGFLMGNNTILHLSWCVTKSFQENWRKKFWKIVTLGQFFCKSNLCLIIHEIRLSVRYLYILWK